MTDAIVIALGISVGGCVTVVFHRWYNDWRNERWHKAREAWIATSSPPFAAAKD